MRIRLTVAALVAALVVYFVLLAQRSLELIGSGRPVAVGLGIGVLILPFIGALLVVMELRFGAATARLARVLAAEGALPTADGLPRRPSGRVDRAAADAHFDVVKARVEADPDNWRGWYELGYAYDLAGDRRRARAALRRAIELAGPA